MTPLSLRCILLITVFTFFLLGSFAQQKNRYEAIHSGIPWYDEQGRTVSAHGANIIKDNGTFYLFGEAHSDTSNAFVGFNCYSSADLCNWKFESVALPVQATGKLGPNRVGERPKVMKCPSTGEYVMFMHVDTLGYTDQYVGYAVSKSVTGPYTFLGPLLFNGKPIKKWDMGTFQDKDGPGYVLLHGGDIYKLSDDYRSISEWVNKAMERKFESPALFRKDSIYYFLGSDLTGWERNDNYYYTATSLKGPWVHRGIFAPKDKLTWNSQTTFVLPIQGSEETTYMFMGDRWSFPRQASAATYIWQPLTVSETSVSIPDFLEAWKVDAETGLVSSAKTKRKTIRNNDKKIVYSEEWMKDTLATISSDKKSASFSVRLTGTQIGFYGLARPDGGYAAVSLTNSKGENMLSSTVDMYSKYPTVSLKFLSPVLPKDEYTLKVTVLAENWYWIDKRKNRTGSKGYFVAVDRIVVKK